MSTPPPNGLVALVAEMLAEHEPTWGCGDPNHTTEEIAWAVAYTVLNWKPGQQD